MIHYSFLSHVGMFRLENQDFYGTWPQLQTFAIADGMGGHSDGALASRYAIEEIGKQCHIDKTKPTEALIEAHKKIVQKNWQSGNSSNMGTTGVVTYIDEEKLCHLAWCGDSRAYKYDNNTKKLIQVSKDHSLVQDLIDLGHISAQEAIYDKRKNIITHALGVGSMNNIRVDYKNIEIFENDYILLCSDGLTNEVDDLSIEQVFKENNGKSNAKLICETLMDMALDNGAKDNVTIGIIGIK